MLTLTLVSSGSATPSFSRASFQSLWLPSRANSVCHLKSRCTRVPRPTRNGAQPEREAVEQGDEADEAFGGTVTRQKCRLMPAPVNFGRGHRFAAYPRCSTPAVGVLDEAAAIPGVSPARGPMVFGAGCAANHRRNEARSLCCPWSELGAKVHEVSLVGLA